MTMKALFAIDGPSGSGKSTTAKLLANRLGLGYLDTGAMYRAATAEVLRVEAGGTLADAAVASRPDASRSSNSFMVHSVTPYSARRASVACICPA